MTQIMTRRVPNIIAICGYKRSGKDTLANIISEKYGHKHIKIASKLKEIVQTLFSFTYDQIENDAKEQVDPRWGITPRQVMQFVGTEMFQYKLQEIMPDVKRSFWIRGLVASLSPTDKVVISDLRFKHEYEELKKLGVYVIKVTRPDLISLQDTHPSETEFNDIPVDLDVVNEGIEFMKKYLVDQNITLL